MKQIAIIPNLEKDREFHVACTIIQLLQGKAKILMDQELVPLFSHPAVTYLPLKDLYQAADIIAVLGGDGTLLGVSSDAARQGKPIFGVNLGRIGFLSSTEKDDLAQMVDKLIAGEYLVEERMMINGHILRANGESIDVLALNDIVISRAAYSRMIGITITIDGELLDSYTADGVILSTPTGSTAYSLSAGGPVAHPTMEVMLITPICPHDLSCKSIVLPACVMIEVSLSASYMAESVVTVDGQNIYKMDIGDRVRISKAPVKTHIIKMHGQSFYSLLRKKLGKRL